MNIDMAKDTDMTLAMDVTMATDVDMDFRSSTWFQDLDRGMRLQMGWGGDFQYSIWVK